MKLTKRLVIIENNEVLFSMHSKRVQPNEIMFYLHFFYQQSDKKQVAGENFLNLLQLVLSDQNFAIDYNKLHPVADHIDTITQIVPNL